MKKIILFLALMVGFSTLASAQSTYVLPAQKYIFDYTGATADTIGAVQTTLSKVVQLNKIDGVFYNIKVKVSDVTAGAACKIYLYGKIFTDDAYTKLDSVIWKGGGTDTTAIFTSNTNKTYNRFLKLELVQTANKSKLTKFVMSVKK